MRTSCLGSLAVPYGESVPAPRQKRDGAVVRAAGHAAVIKSPGR